VAFEALHHPASQRGVVRRKRVVGGLILVVVAAGLGTGVHAGSTWSVEAGPGRLVFFVLSGWQLLLVAHVISGLAAATALALLIPLLIRKISRVRVRRLAAVTAVLGAVAAAVPWLFYFAGIGLNVASATHTKVAAGDGRSVIVGQSGFDRRDYVVYSHEALLLWKKSAAGKSVSDVFNPDACTVATGVAGGADLQLTCGADSILVPPVGS
jgi:hypothetical protein